MNYEVLEKILDFCSITDFESRKSAVKVYLFMEDSVINYVQQLIDDTEIENDKLNLIEHKNLIKTYQMQGISALDYFVSPYQIEFCFTKFCFGFDEIKARKDYLLKHPFLMDEMFCIIIKQNLKRTKGCVIH